MNVKRDADHEFHAYCDIREEILGYLRNQAFDSTESFVISGATPVDLSLGRLLYESPQGLLVEGATLAPAIRRLRHLLGSTASASGVPSSYFADRDAVQEASERGYDPVLYRAYRDIFPPRNKKSDGRPSSAGPRRADPEDGTSWWYADLVVYPPGLLPGGEPYRSTGHWNSDAQLEIFQTLTGKVLMLTGSRLGERGLCLKYQICRSGDIAVIPFGDWHLTYCLEGPAAVFNIYTDLPSLSGGARHSGRDAALDGSVKYASGESVEVAVVREAGSVGFVGKDTVAGLPRETAPPSWIHQYVVDGIDLSGLYLFGTTELLGALEGTALSAAGQP
jgi:hypothetical protein